MNCNCFIRNYVKLCKPHLGWFFLFSEYMKPQIFFSMLHKAQQYFMVSLSRNSWYNFLHEKCTVGCTGCGPVSGYEDFCSCPMLPLLLTGPVQPRASGMAQLSADPWGCLSEGICCSACTAPFLGTFFFWCHLWPAFTTALLSFRRATPFVICLHTVK